MAKFLIIRFSSIGDIVLTTPVIRSLKKQVDGAEVHYLTKKQFAGILAPNPYIDKLHLMGENLDTVINQLKKESFDYVIDLHHNLRTLRVKRALKKPSFSFNKLNLEKWMLTALKINRMPAVHIVDRYLETVAGFGVQNDGAGLDYFLSDADHVQEADIPHGHLAGYIGVVVGAALATKQLPADKLIDLCSAVKRPVILLGGPEDRVLGDQIASIDPERIYNACGKFSLGESADLVRRAKVIVTHDTGLMHIAAAFRKPIISIWGNTVPAFGMTPYFGNARVPEALYEVKGLGCRPCSKIGYRKCPKGHFKCMNEQPIFQIAALADSYLA